MSTYVIGDVQGCYDPLMRLLDQINFDPTQDQLWFTGDLVNRGPKSLEVLRFIKKNKFITVLGNHDIHLICTFDGIAQTHPKDTLKELLDAPDIQELVDYLRQLPLLYENTDQNKTKNYGLVHAGVLPQWTWDQARKYAREAESFLQNKNLWLENIQNFYGDMPNIWTDNLENMDRLRLIFNGFTRLRICKSNGECDFKFKRGLNDIPKDYFPWFAVPNRQTQDQTILFGHWSALLCETNDPKFIALDSGCVWGNGLTAYCLETGKRECVK